jgi:decaprenylphospho-beta-D-ribofuranose 2-oxidase
MRSERVEIHHAWGLNLKSRGFSTSNPNEIIDLARTKDSRGAIPYGLGRSYGDSALNSGGFRLNSKNYRFIEINESTGIARCGSGISIRELEYESSLRGFLPAVVPGTGFVSLGGAFASDIHGKSQQIDGNFADHVVAVTIMDSNGNERKYLPESEEFKATAGGMGLTGFITELEIKLKKVNSLLISQKETRVFHLNEMLKILENLEEEYPYTVAWLDLSGKFSGRGLVLGGKLMEKSIDNKKSKINNFGFKKETTTFRLPFIKHFNFMNKISIRIFNELWFRKPVKKGITSFQKFMHPLDSIGNWNYVYGKNGFIQYQFVIPIEQTKVLYQILEVLKELHVSSFLTVLKKFGREGSGYLSFPIPGWTLAMDFSSSVKNLPKAIEKIDQLVTQAGGRIYLTKDSTSNPISINLMYPNLKRWKQVKIQMDPNSFWVSDQARRLELC